MSRSIPLPRLPQGFNKVAVVGIYTFFENKNEDFLIWKREDKVMFIKNHDLVKVPKDERNMFWYDSSYYETFIKDQTEI